MSKERNNLLIAASGTGGHIFPALAVSKEVEKYWNMHWLGVEKRLDSKFVPRKYNLLTLNLETPQKSIFILFQYLKILYSTFNIIKILKEKKINLVFTTGGFISAPTILAAKLLNIPVIIHESNLIPGTVTKYFGFLCEFVLIGFKDTNAYLKNCKTIFTGTPLRPEFYKTNPLPEWVPRGKGPLLIVMGGSQGAKRINEIFYESLDLLIKQNFRIVHIVGEHNINIPRKIKSNNYVQKKFTNQIASLMQNCDLVISRSGAGTINELIQTKKPSILVPYPNSKNNHQEKNAIILSSIGGAILINQDKISKVFFQETLKRIFKVKKNKGKPTYEILDLMKENMKNLTSLKSTNKIKNLINYFLKEF
ncbi:Undecaprenyl-PP-MurNAc-pentapeptide-UDPGlcNAc GlcNAc transferase [Prochlorococcus marinus str. MIT 9515]|uniref:UDP-N-acetylglucosamine--N-acetylmuramyl-(pentapeptide) pyrophosphoryl-undecaprenol N-acetylglucosamine transferase n=1 Tax=Prochlorococcus marinus (strain MIT 9515) TaxID=167542 RepID=MURG_PROM5|nr:UDP-N-acetylglucosamine--N-acetylmuramyl-(pentapeptide) pyrophosphoryl-undecaprenol N-acetylglucosamine transferase [Prochlorococcus marinus]A2BUH4.1 RecName: Full=UDP-N-acetylglucosamine--N-acetylmuramyl-(pentapeptide) pyrophosphoryl-undecaprenol N-acetylglucosamine transferase; AltName: Full=Undecaprenyl-PP-MurNAc-pentapeptide-UDPGlcNAc GlcNAc transferase [Prochlorococcus marinus str. MIT 9515]ABM71435.1 Undecaprenyl-PP-MurNAc-pentapeptide-UDPGlcNAc GlcNAc transferase [Prochlorococcus marinu